MNRIVSKVREKCRKSLEKFLTKYGKLEKGDETALKVENYLFENFKLPIVNWIFQIIFTSIPISLTLLAFNVRRNVIPISIGISLLWWIIIEFRKDWKR